ncbi:MAG: DUF4249 domain-containing protein [Prevotella sp.]
MISLTSIPTSPRRIAFMLLMTAVLWCGCEGDYMETQPSQLVVEGWIEHNGFPVVMVTQTVPVSTEPTPLDNLEEYIVKWAKVSVSDGQETVVLTGKYDNRYFPPYIYTTSKLRGMQGKDYTLTVEYDGQTATAITHVPAPPQVESIWQEPSPDNDTLVVYKVRLHDNPEEKNYYQLFSNSGDGYLQQLSATYMGCISDEVIDGWADFTVYRPYKATDEDNTTVYFGCNDLVVIKVAQIDEASYDFWSDYGKNLLLSDNLLVPFRQNIRSNIHGGYGIWCGMGCIQAFFGKQAQE